jgi:hypothetical protein
VLSHFVSVAIEDSHLEHRVAMIVDSETYSVVTRVVGYATSQVRLAASGNAALEHPEKCIRTENGKIVFGLAVRRQAPTIEKLGVWPTVYVQGPPAPLPE